MSKNFTNYKIVQYSKGKGEGVHYSGVQPLPVGPDVDPQVGALAKDGLPLDAKELYYGVMLIRLQYSPKWF